MGGVLGLAVLGTIAVATTRTQISSFLAGLGPKAAGAAARYVGSAPPPNSAPIPAAIHYGITSAFVAGYTTAFVIGSGILAAAFLLAVIGLRRTDSQ